MWYSNVLEEDDMGVQPWSKPGSNIRHLGRPYTGICRRPDGTKFLVYAPHVLHHQDALRQLQPLADEEGGELVACIGGWHERDIVNTVPLHAVD